MVDNKKIEFIIKYDHQLSKKELTQVFQVYNECFYDNKVNSTKKIKQVYQWLGNSHIFQWYLLKVDDRIIGIANFVYDPTNVTNFAIKSELGENISSVGVLCKYRGFGYARLLMEKLIEEHQDIDLVVEIKKGNPAYIGLLQFYQKLGFTEIKEIGDDTYLKKLGKEIKNLSEIDSLDQEI